MELLCKHKQHPRCICLSVRTHPRARTNTHEHTYARSHPRTPTHVAPPPHHHPVPCARASASRVGRCSSRSDGVNGFRQPGMGHCAFRDSMVMIPAREYTCPHCLLQTGSTMRVRVMGHVVTAMFAGALTTTSASSDVLAVRMAFSNSGMTCCTWRQK